MAAFSGGRPSAWAPSIVSRTVTASIRLWLSQSPRTGQRGASPNWMPRSRSAPDNQVTTAATTTPSTTAANNASAAETARTRRGDCTEHGVLLAAMLRAAGIPSRVACGLIYVDGFVGSENIFGYHMWAEALLDVHGQPTWVDLDATLGPEAAFDAAHIALTVTALADGQPQDALVTLATIIGRLRIKVESVQ